MIANIRIAFADGGSYERALNQLVSQHTAAELRWARELGLGWQPLVYTSADEQAAAESMQISLAEMSEAEQAEFWRTQDDMLRVAPPEVRKRLAQSLNRHRRRRA